MGAGGAMIKVDRVRSLRADQCALSMTTILPLRKGWCRLELYQVIISACFPIRRQRTLTRKHPCSKVFVYSYKLAIEARRCVHLQN